ncbi:MAG: glycosyltransferase family 2 protein [Desulfamplus sp.]|nr:glycosyltransferase family 2 protein [Desulfamplus sp.]
MKFSNDRKLSISQAELPNKWISIVIPVHNEALNIPELYKRICALFNRSDSVKSDSVFNKSDSDCNLNWAVSEINNNNKKCCLNYSVEIIFVDDGSSDNSVEILKTLQENDPSIIVVSLNRSFGHQIAITAGLDHSSGDAVVTMDGDLQHPPEVIHEMIEKWQQGFDVVNGARTKREGEGRLKRYAASLFYSVFRKIADYDVVSREDVGDFRLLDRKVVTALSNIRERRRYIRGLVSWMGYSTANVYYDQSPRFAGESKYSFWKSLLLSLDAITTFSYVPLRIAAGIGIFFSIMGFLLGFHALYLKLFTDSIQVPGWTVMFVELTFLGGVQLIVLGVLGEYLGRVFEEVRDRPLYYIKNVHKKQNQHSLNHSGNLNNSGNLNHNGNSSDDLDIGSKENGGAVASRSRKSYFKKQGALD